MVANRNIADAILRHQIDLRRFATGEVREMLALLEESNDDIIARLRRAFDRGGPTFGTRRMEAMLRSIRDARRAVMAELRSRVQTDMVHLAKVEAATEVATFKAAIPVEFEMAGVAVAKLRAAVVERPFLAPQTGAASSLGEWMGRLEASDTRRVEGIVRLGIVQGKNVDDMVRELLGTRARGFTDGAFALTRRNAETMIRTAVSHVSSAARDLIHDANSDIIEALRLVATLDGRTSAICRARDGKFVPVGNNELPAGFPALSPPGARLPFHPNERSVMIPIVDVEGFAELLGDRPFVVDARGRRQREIDFRANAKRAAGDRWREMSAAERRAAIRDVKERWSARAIGQVPATETYGPWLRRQSAEFQDQVLGKAKGRLFRQGGLKIENFVDFRGDELSLDELAKKHPSAFMKSGMTPEQSINAA